MQMEIVHEKLQRWGEIMVTTASGERFELHLGDTRWDLERRVIEVEVPDGGFVLDGDCIDVVRWHLARRE